MGRKPLDSAKKRNFVDVCNDAGADKVFLATMPQRVKPKKSLGQHFLTDLGIARRIAATLEPYAGLPVLEVGPGMGVLTQFLLERGMDVRVAEIDHESVAYLTANFPALKGRIIDGDFLQLNLNDVSPEAEKISVIGNYPYNISSQILFHVLEFRDRVECCSGMFQREVAERLAAPAGSRTRGILSVLLQAWYDIEYLFTVDEHVFNPPPKVKSGVIRMTRNGATALGCDERLFKTVVKTAFGQRRKTLRNSLRSLIAAGSAPADCGIMTMRPEQLTVAQFVDLTNIISQSRTPKE